MCQSQQTYTAAVLGTGEDYPRTELQGFVYLKGQLTLPGDHFVGDYSNNASPLLLVDIV